MPPLTFYAWTLVLLANKTKQGVSVKAAQIDDQVRGQPSLDIYLFPDKWRGEDDQQHRQSLC